LPVVQIGYQKGSLAGEGPGRAWLPSYGAAEDVLRKVLTIMAHAAPIGGHGMHSLTATAIQKAATAVSVAFLGVGVLGFVPGVTTNLDEITFSGHESEAMLIGVFQVSILHNVVHLLLGVIGLVLASTTGGARGFLLGGGVVYLLLWLYGLLVDEMSSANFVPLNNADDWLHLGLAAAMILLGIILGPRTTSSRAATD
jgi:hypothetical protein